MPPGGKKGGTPAMEVSYQEMQNIEGVEGKKAN